MVSHMRFLVSALFLLATAAAHAEVRLPHILSDHAVFQRGRPLHIWGWAAPGEPVAVSFHAQQAAVTADELGRWSVYLRPEPAGGPYTLTVKGSSTVTVQDLMVGDVWFASGQSNMEMPLRGFPGSAVLKDGPAEIASANQPRLRLLRFPHASSPYEQRDIDASWTLCTPQTAADFSAVAYFFGRGLAKEQGVTTGLINSTWGGTPAAAWVSLDGLSADAGLMPAFAARAKMAEEQEDVPALLAKDKREDAAAKAAGKPKPSHAFHPDPASYDPAGLFNAMVAPALPYGIRGVLWYQGETDSGLARAPLYEQIFPALIRDWRARWGEGDFPFLFAQISSYTSTPAESWGTVREAQRRALGLADTAMVVTLDVGQADNVHPPDKQTVGARFFLAADSVAYGKPGEWSGPLFRQAVPEPGAVRVYFTHAGGLAAKDGALRGFELAGADHRFRPAEASVDGDTVVVRAEGVAQPEYVRYAWSNSALDANLYNAAGLPASTFTSERHPAAP